MDQLFLRHSKLIDAAAPIKKERLEIDKMIEVTLESLCKVKASKKK
jgi:hypothetical protein